MNLRERKRKVLNVDDYVENVPKKARGRAPGRPKGSPNKKRTNPAGSAESEILQALRSGQNINKLVDNWIKEYEENVDLAIVKILQFFISATGCKGAVSAVMVKSMEFKNIIANLSDEFEEDCNDYPLTMSGPQWKKFRSLFGDFIMIFVTKIKSGIIFDEGFTDFVLQLLTGLADSQIRAFRHTATFAAMKFSSAMVDVVVELTELKEKNNKQIETEKTKLKQRGTNERLDALLNVKNDLETKTQELCLMIQFVFKSVFAHRYRDTVPDIRCICMVELGNWMAAYPALFLEDSYLKYVGWSLFDKNAEVRMKCVAILLPLYERQDLVARMELFTSKFKDRLVSMVTDKDIDVAVKSCHLITQIHCAFPSMLQLKDCVPIYETVYCTNRPLAVAAGCFLNARVFQPIDEEGAPVDKRLLIQNLVAFFIEGEVHNHSAYLVDALTDTNPIIKDWSLMADMLLSDEVGEADDQLIEIMVCSVKQAATMEPPVGRQSTKKGATTTSAKDPRAIQEERTRITEAFIPTLPRLINKFIADQDKINSLTQLPLFFELDIYQVGRHERQLAELMESFDRIFDQHSDDEILRNVVKALNYFSDTNSVAQLTETPRTQLIHRISVQFRQSAQQALAESNLDEEDEAAVLVGFRKLAALSIVFELRDTEIWEAVVHVLKNAARFHTSDIVEKGVLLLFYIFARDVKNAVAGKESKAAINRIKKRRDEFLQCVRDIIEHSASNVEQAFFCLCDTLILCNWKLKDADERVCDLIVSLDARFIDAINRFVVQNVFEVSQEAFERLDQQSQIELTCKRRVVLGQYCKLIIYGLLPIVDISLILRFFHRSFADYGDIVKHLLTRCRDMNRLAMTQAMIRALKDVYEEMKEASAEDYVDPLSEEFTQLRDLAKRFAGQITGEQAKNREAVALIHQTGIYFALGIGSTPQKTGRGRRQQANDETQSISFLEILIEFSAKLLRQDKAAVLKYLVDHSNPPADYAENETWQPFLLYKNSLSTARTNN